MGATPLDVVAFLLLFVVYNNFTSETQDVRLDYKDLVLFPKWRLLIPLVLTVVGIFINPAIGIAVFMACFVLELLATVFKRIPEQERPAVHRVIVLSVLSAIVTAVGAYVGPTISGDYYFGLVGLAILAITAFAWYAGRNRNAFKGIWEFIWVDSRLYEFYGSYVANDYCSRWLCGIDGYLWRIWHVLIAILYYSHWCGYWYTHVWFV